LLSPGVTKLFSIDFKRELCHGKNSATNSLQKFLKLYVFIRGKIKKALQIGLSVHLKPDKSSYRRR
ncbi:TPA: hypothetical protein ACJZY7_001593, partial [Streptococcus pneumoniae]